MSSLVSLLVIVGIVIALAVSMVVFARRRLTRPLDPPARRSYLPLAAPLADAPVALASPVAINLADREITAYGDELRALDAVSSPAALTPTTQDAYGRALDAYDSAKTLLSAANTADDIARVGRVLASGREAIAIVLKEQA